MNEKATAVAGTYRPVGEELERDGGMEVSQMGKYFISSDTLAEHSSRTPCKNIST